MASRLFDINRNVLTTRSRERKYPHGQLLSWIHFFPSLWNLGTSLPGKSSKLKATRNSLRFCAIIFKAKLSTLFLLARMTVHCILVYFHTWVRAHVSTYVCYLDCCALLIFSKICIFFVCYLLLVFLYFFITCFFVVVTFRVKNMFYPHTILPHGQNVDIWVNKQIK